MMRLALLTAGVAALFWVSAGSAHAAPASDAPAPRTARSSAAAVDLRFVVNRQVSDPAPELLVAGVAPPSYAKKIDRALYSRTTKILGGLVFTRSANSVETVATGRINTTTGAASKGEASVLLFSGKLSSPLGTLITVTSGPISAEATFTRTQTGVSRARGTVSITSLKISAPALGIAKSFSGTPRPNQVLYQSSDQSIVIYLNRQIVTRVAGRPTEIMVRAVDVEIKRLNLGSNMISGSILVEPTLAK